MLDSHHGLWRCVLPVFLLCCVDSAALARPKMEGLHSNVPCSRQVAAVEGLLSRLVGDANAAAFELEIQPAEAKERFYELQVPKKRFRGKPIVRVVADSGVSLASGIYSYFKEDMSFMVTWGEDGTGDNLPPSADKQAWYPHWKSPRGRRVVSNSQVQYYENVCTFGYSQTWWDWQRWERELDWMALHGINLPLAFVGQEKMWLELFTSEAHLDQKDVLSWMSGPAFLPWFRMGNMRSFGGPLTTHWIEGQHQLQLQILERMRSFGMTPVLPGFAGHLPQSFASLHPDAKVTTTPSWNGFDAVALLEATDPLFPKLGAALARLQSRYYGFLPQVVNADTYNEMDPRSGDLDYLQSAGAAPWEGIRSVNADGILMIQGWLFYSSETFWTEPRIEAYLSGVPESHMIILDLYSDAKPQWQRTNSYFGRPWIWNMLLNFGGNRGLYGSIDGVGSDALRAVQNKSSSCIGLGMTPEAIENNPVMFELLSEMSWRSTPISGKRWLPDYVQRRYGTSAPKLIQAQKRKPNIELHPSPGHHHLAGLQPYCSSMLCSASGDNVMLCSVGRATLFNAFSLSGAGYGIASLVVKAWQKLHRSVYNTSMISKSLVRLYPTLNVEPATSSNVTQLTEAARLLIAGAQDESPGGPLAYDIVDVVRQVLDFHFAELYKMLRSIFQNSGIPASAKEAQLEQVGSMMLSLISDQDKLLATNANYLLGRWLAGARAWADEQQPEEVNRLMFNAINQVTRWGDTPHGEINDYASKAWAGLTIDYYFERWLRFCRFLQFAAIDNQTFPDASYAFAQDTFQVEYNEKVAQQSLTYTTKPEGDVVVEAKLALERYTGQAHRREFEVWDNQDSRGGDIIQAATRDVDQLAALCRSNPGCTGFNSNGYLKSGNISRGASSGTTLYIRRSQVASLEVGESLWM